MDEILSYFTSQRDSDCYCSVRPKSAAGGCEICNRYKPLIKAARKAKAQIATMIGIINDVAQTCCECNADNRCNACRALELTSRG